MKIITAWSCQSPKVLSSEQSPACLRLEIPAQLDRVFTQLNVAPGLIALTAWVLRKEWIRELRMEVKADAGVPEIQRQSGVLNPID